ncbi:hypothetical protein Tco_0256454 [Tanacetum coccineum]
MLVVVLDPGSRVTLAKAKSNPSKAQHKFIPSFASSRCYLLYPFASSISSVWESQLRQDVGDITNRGHEHGYPGKFQEYQLTDKEKEMERMMIYWEQVEYEVSDDDDSDLKSTARSVPKDYELEDTGDSSGI